MGGTAAATAAVVVAGRYFAVMIASAYLSPVVAAAVVAKHGHKFARRVTITLVPSTGLMAGGGAHTEVAVAGVPQGVSIIPMAQYIIVRAAAAAAAADILQGNAAVHMGAAMLPVAAAVVLAVVVAQAVRDVGVGFV